MSTLSFMPWCRIDKTYEVGCIKILPFERHNSLEGMDDASQCHVNMIMATYKNIEGKPVDRTALVAWNGKSLIDNLTDEEIEIVHELTTVACFCGLAKREYLNPLGPYCNSDCFVLYIQKFDKTDFTAITIRRRDGRTLSGWPIDEIAITIPVHCHTIEKVTLDEALLKALSNFREQSNNNKWGRWQNAISCFNQANTDNDSIRYQAEWVLLCSAFEHLLGAKSEAKDVASKFSETMIPSEPLLACNAMRRSGKWADKGKSLRYEWMREFYRIRGDFAHGKLSTQQPTVWNPLEHLVLAAISFPLVVKSLLGESNYKMTEEDQAQIDCFEKLADTPDFLKPPQYQKGSLDSHWRRLCSKRKWEIASKNALKEFVGNERTKEESKPERGARVPSKS